MPTKRTPNPQPLPAPPDQPASNPELPRLSDELTADVLKGSGDHLNQRPSSDYVLGKYKTSPRATTWREYLMWAMLRIRDKNGHLRPLILNRAQQDLEARARTATSC